MNLSDDYSGAMLSDHYNDADSFFKDGQGNDLIPNNQGSKT
jgi:hypothetical protein